MPSLPHTNFIHLLRELINILHSPDFTFHLFLLTLGQLYVHEFSNFCEQVFLKSWQTKAVLWVYVCVCVCKCKRVYRTGWGGSGWSFIVVSCVVAHMPLSETLEHDLSPLTLSLPPTLPTGPGCPVRCREWTTAPAPAGAALTLSSASLCPPSRSVSRFSLKRRRPRYPAKPLPSSPPVPRGNTLYSHEFNKGRCDMTNTHTHSGWTKHWTVSKECIKRCSWPIWNWELSTLQHWTQDGGVPHKLLHV